MLDYMKDSLMWIMYRVCWRCVADCVQYQARILRHHYHLSKIRYAVQYVRRFFVWYREKREMREEINSFVSNTTILICTKGPVCWHSLLKRGLHLKVPTYDVRPYDRTTTYALRTLGTYTYITYVLHKEIKKQGASTNKTFTYKLASKTYVPQ